MIAACPSCGARYRIDVAKLRPEGARLRCSRCENVFRVRAPEAPPPERSPAPPKPKVEPPLPPAAAPEVRRESPRETPPPPDDPRSQRLVLVAHPEAEQGRRIAEALAAWGLETLVVHDGVEAILAIQRELPRLVVLDAALPKMFGFQVCELMKRNESLRVIRVILVGAIHHQDRYRRAPSDLYGADAYVERHQLPDALAPLCEQLGLPISPRPGALPAPPPRRAPPPAPEPRFEPPPPARPRPEPAPQAAPAPREQPPAPAFPQPAAPAPPPREQPPLAPADPALAAETQQAERLARIIVSDVVLYNPEKFEAGVRDGNVLQTLEGELEEGRSLFAQRVDPRVGDPGEFLERELLRVARSRGMK